MMAPNRILTQMNDILANKRVNIVDAFFKLHSKKEKCSQKDVLKIKAKEHNFIVPAQTVALSPAP